MHPQIFSAVVMRKSVDMRRFVRAQVWVAAMSVWTVTGCAPQFQTQIVGRTTAVAGPPGASSAVAAEIPVPESPNAQVVLRYVVALPRAVQLRYQVACPTAEREGTLGETFETYRTRRLAELERERRAEANLIGAVPSPAPADRRRSRARSIRGPPPRTPRRRRCPPPACPRATPAPRSCAARWSWALRPPVDAR